MKFRWRFGYLLVIPGIASALFLFTEITPWHMRLFLVIASLVSMAVAGLSKPNSRTESQAHNVGIGAIATATIGLLITKVFMPVIPFALNIVAMITSVATALVWLYNSLISLLYGRKKQTSLY